MSISDRFKGLYTGLVSKIGSIHLLRSFRFRIFVLMLVIGVIPSIFIRAAILSSYENRAISVRESEVQNQLGIIAKHLITYDYLRDPTNEAINAELEQMSNLYDGRILIIGGNFKAIKDTNGVSAGKIIVSEEVIKCFKGQKVVNYDSKNGYIEMTTPITETVTDEETGANTDVVRGVMLSSVSTDTIAMTMRIIGRVAWTIDIVVIAIVFAIAMLFSRVLTKPFNKVTGAISEVGEGFTDEALSVPDYAETEHIVDAFNKVLARMRALDESRQEFVANVSHELKTPITSMKILADSLMEGPDKPVELYREFMEDIAGEIDREDKIISDLLTLVRLDKTNTDLDLSSNSINAMIEMILKRLKPIAAGAGVELIFESAREVVTGVDEVKLNLALTNLIENAIKYNRPGGSVYVSLDCDHQYFTVEIKDTGIGMPEEALEHIFERFYRVDKSHSREIGGTGLGLSIARNIIMMHRGTVSVESVTGEGSVFTVKVPLV